MSDDDNSSLVNDVAGLAKLANSKLANKVYDDVVSGSAKEAGKTLTHVTKACRLFLTPFQLAALWTDRIDKWYAEVTRDVPEESQQEAPPEIAGPALQNLMFMEDDNRLARIYIELLKRAIDKRRCEEVHPAFVKITGELSPDEAFVLYLMRNQSYPIRASGDTYDVADFSQGRLRYKERIWTYLSHLESLGLVSLPIHLDGRPKGLFVSQGAFLKNAVIRLTPFGTQYVRACIPDGFSL